MVGDDIEKVSYVQYPVMACMGKQIHFAVQQKLTPCCKSTILQ